MKTLWLAFALSAVIFAAFKAGAETCTEGDARKGAPRPIERPGDLPAVPMEVCSSGKWAVTTGRQMFAFLTALGPDEEMVALMVESDSPTDTVSYPDLLTMARASGDGGFDYSSTESGKLDRVIAAYKQHFKGKPAVVVPDVEDGSDAGVKEN